jgi:putative ABC transport system permease protein
MGTSPDIIKAFQVLSIESGELFKSEESTGTVVIGPLTSDALFGEGADPLGKIITINKSEFTIVGKLGKAKFSSLFGSEYDNLILMSTADAAKFNNNTEKIMRIVVKAKNEADVKQTKTDLVNALKTNREDGEQNFSVLTQDDLLGLMDDLLNLSTALVSAIAGISLVVGGIGIMNIMLVTVTERTQEIGLRKALGATSLAILTQFLTEAVVITLLGGIIGLGISIFAGYIVSIKTPLSPELSPVIVLTAMAISTVVGVIFGIWPAMRAAQKDPIEALRYE